jgi:phosphate transport system substrate-binding protein
MNPNTAPAARRLSPAPNRFGRIKGSYLFAATLSASLLSTLAPADEQAPAIGSDNADASMRSAAAHLKMLKDKPHRQFYTTKFDLSGLPRYEPKGQVSGAVRIVGNNYIGDSYVAKWWTEDFHKYQPNVKLTFFMPTAAIAFAALEFDGGDMVMDHAGLFYDFLGFEREYGYDPIEITALTGSYNVTGWNSARTIVVNKANPLNGISMQQLDGVFGSERAGGWDKATWRPDWARSRAGDIRTWGQLGLTGEWADREIKTYGFACRYETATLFADTVIKGSDKWNPNYQGYANYRRPDGTWYIEGQQVADHVARDRYSLAFILWEDDYGDRTKRIPVAPGDTRDYVMPSWDTLFSCAYPLYTHFYWYLNLKPGAKLKPAVREFLLYAISRQGQEVLERDGKYLPINAGEARENMHKLAESGN